MVADSGLGAVVRSPPWLIGLNRLLALGLVIALPPVASPTECPYSPGCSEVGGYFCRSSGNVTDEVIKGYIESQSHDSDEVFRLEGEESPPEEPPSA
jgi:hypothetical protein